MTSQPFAAQVLSRVSMWPIPLTPLTAAVRTLNVPSVSSSSRDLALVALCFLWVDFSARFPRHFSRANALRLSLSSRCFLPRFLPSFFRRVGCGNPTTPRVLHRRHFAFSRVPSSHSSSPRFGSRVFRDGGVPTLLPQAPLPRETISPCWGSLPPVDAVGMLALSASTSFRINRCHEGTLIHPRIL